MQTVDITTPVVLHGIAREFGVYLFALIARAAAIGFRSGFRRARMHDIQEEFLRLGADLGVIGFAMFVACAFTSKTPLESIWLLFVMFFLLVLITFFFYIPLAGLSVDQIRRHPHRIRLLVYFAVSGLVGWLALGAAVRFTFVGSIHGS